jgi:ubiquinone/menaquinone biosynthesis C-methylase UbiE
MYGHPIEGSATATRDFYDRISRVYDLIADVSEHDARETGLKALGLCPGQHALEIGFGTGHAAAWLAEAVGPAGRVCGLDISPGMLEVARRRVAETGMDERVELRLGDARELPYASSSFDAVFMSFTLELFPLPEIPRVLAECRRVLTPSGRLGLVSLFRNGQPNTLTELYVWLHRHFPHFIDCQPIDGISFLRQAGFSIQTQQTLSIWGLPVVVAVGSPT